MQRGLTLVDEYDWVNTSRLPIIFTYGPFSHGNSQVIVRRRIHSQMSSLCKKHGVSVIVCHLEAGQGYPRFIMMSPTGEIVNQFLLIGLGLVQGPGAHVCQVGFYLTTPDWRPETGVLSVHQSTQGPRNLTGTHMKQTDVKQWQDQSTTRHLLYAIRVDDWITALVLSTHTYS